MDKSKLAFVRSLARSFVRSLVGTLFALGDLFRSPSRSEEERIRKSESKRRTPTGIKS